MISEGLREEANFKIVPELNDLGLLRATYINHSFPRHFHESFTIAVHERGAEEFTCQGRTWLSPVGSIVLINPGEVHTGRRADVDDRWTYRSLYPNPSLFEVLGSQPENSTQNCPYFPSPVVFDAALARTWLNVHKVLQTSNDVLEKQSLFTSAAVDLICRHAAPRPSLRKAGSERPAVRVVLEFINSHYMENPSLDDLAGVTGLNPFYLLRVFRKEIGMPPHEYLNQIRVNCAMKLLARGRPIVEVALETGFTDQSHFTHRFKRHTGLTPKQFVRGRSS
ncbi:MAG: AraC family transcriptional regulator [Pyrinomonadaceae bacterium]